MSVPGRILETVLYVDDLDAAERFYTGIMGLRLHSKRPGIFSFFEHHQAMLLLFDPRRSMSNAEIPAHGAQGAGHACFAVPATELAAWAARLEAAGVAIERVVDWPQGGRSLYFRDPAGNSLEFATPCIWGLPEEVS